MISFPLIIFQWEVQEILLVYNQFGGAWVEARGGNVRPLMGMPGVACSPRTRIGPISEGSEAAQRLKEARANLVGKQAVTIIGSHPALADDAEAKAPMGATLVYQKTFILPYQKAAIKKTLAQLGLTLEALVKSKAPPSPPAGPIEQVEPTGSAASRPRLRKALRALKEEERKLSASQSHAGKDQALPPAETKEPHAEIETPSSAPEASSGAASKDAAVSEEEKGVKEAAKPFKLTPTQARAMEAIKDFLKREDKAIFVLKGYAGTGKTTMVKVILDWLTTASQDYEPVLLASTGRAARILSNKAGVTAATVHSYLYFFSDIEEKGEKPWHPESPGQIRLIFEPRADRNDRFKPALYIIDESSMISDQPSASPGYTRFGSGRLLLDFFNMLQQETPGSKVIFIGDPLQLPPVARDPFSPALHPPYLKKMASWPVEEAELTDVVRQQDANSHILELAFRLRECVINEDYPSWENLIMAYEGNGILFYESEQDWLDAYALSHKRGDYAQSIVITHTNKQALELNQQYRRLRHGPEVQMQLLPHELLMVSQNNLRVNLSNGDQISVLKIHGKQRQGYFEFLDVTVENIHSHQVFQTLLLPAHLFDAQSNLPADFVRRLIIDFDQRMRNREIRRRSDEYKDKMRTDPYLNALRAKFGYAVTTHKSQGGEWPEVFLNLSSSINMRQMNNEERFRWLYTSITRAKQKLHIRKIYRPRYRRRFRLPEWGSWGNDIW